MTVQSFWEYSSSLYAEPGVAEYCIDMQDRYGALVNLMLFCCWVGSRQIELDKSAIKQAEQSIADFNAAVTSQIRRRRRELSRTVDGMDESGVDAKRILLEAELNAERDEHQKLLDWFSDAVLPGPPEGWSANKLIMANLRCYLDSCNIARAIPSPLLDAALKNC